MTIIDDAMMALHGVFFGDAERTENELCNDAAAKENVPKTKISEFVCSSL